MTLALDLPDCRDSALGRMDTRWKLAGLFTSAILIGFLQTWQAVGLAFGGSIILVGLAQLPWRWYVVRLGAAALFLGFFAVWLPFLPAPGDETAAWLGLRISLSGLSRGGLILVKGLTLLSLMLAMLATAPLPQSLQA